MSSGETAPDPPRGFGKATLAATSVTVVSSLPGFLAGALSVQLSSGLRFTTTQLGISVALWRLSAAASSTWLGRFTDRIGGRWALRVAAIITAISCVGIAMSASNWAVLTLWLIAAGWAHALGIPAANRMLSSLVPDGRQGLAFGIKQAAPPLASMLAGLSVPLVAVNYGWRAVFYIAGAIAVATQLLVGRRPLRANRTTPPAGKNLPPPDWRILRTLMLAIGLATLASSTVPVYMVPSSVAAGMSPSTAGAALAAASLAAVVVRIVLGVFADRRETDYLRVCAVALAVGAVGLALLYTGDPAMMTAGGILGLAGAWGFPGLYWLAIVRAFPETPGRTTGALAPGAMLGATFGPLVGGVLADQVGFAATWAFSAIVAALAAGAMMRASRRLSGRTVGTELFAEGV